MKEKSIQINGFHKTESTALWKWKGIDFQSAKPQGNLFPVTEFFHETSRKIDDVVLGPGVGAGVGCGVGLGLGVVGGAGFVGSAWNRLSTVLGIGIGCGVGIGVGYGQGFGAGFGLETLRSHLLDPKPKSKKRIRVQI